MNYRTIIMILVISNFMGLFCNAQDEISTQPPSVFSPSPNVAQMTMFLDQEVNYSTGIPEIRIPLYTISEGDISIPITLDYYAGGIKVSQEASNVGLGWSLSAGGVLSREIRGIIDDFNSNHEDNTVDGILYSDISLVQIVQGLGEIEQINYQHLNEVDLEADLFNIVFPTGEGSKFAYNQTMGKFVELENKNNKIKYNTEYQGDRPKRIYSWEIINSEGIRYRFGEKSDSVNFNNPKYSEKNTRELIYNSSIPPQINSEPEGISSWYLNQVMDTKGNFVNFHYRNHAQVEYYNKLPFKGSVNFIDPQSPTSTRVLVDEKAIKEINFTSGKVKFYYSENFREDLKNSRSLKEIKIFDNNNQLIKSIEFLYSYFDCKSSNHAPYIGETEYYEKRLKLNTVKIKGKESDSPIFYRFDYNSTLLPSKFSYAQDYWGGYNGKTENIRMTPATTFYRQGEMINDWSYVEELEKNGGKRNVDKDFVAAGMLTKIVYPSGGYTVYEYEPNTISEYEYLESYYPLDEKVYVKNIKNPYLEKELQFYSGSNAGGDGGCTREDISDFQVNYYCSFTLENPLQSPLPYIDFNSGFFHCPEGSVTIIDDPKEGIPQADEIVCKFFPAYYKRKTDPVGSKLIDGDWMFLDPENEEDKNLELVIKFNGSKEILNYNYGQTEDRANFFIYDTYKEDIDPINRYVGGIRVKSIENFDADGVRKSIKEFQYEFESKSSGRAMLPQFALYENLYYYPNINFEKPYSPYTFLISDTNINPFFNNKVAYGKVKETIKEIDQENGNNLSNKIVSIYEFNNPISRSVDVSYRESNFIIRPYKFLDVSWNNSKTREYFYNNENQIVSESSFVNYFSGDSITNNVFFSGCRIVDFSHLTLAGFLNASLVFDYNNIYAHSNIINQTTVSYFGNSETEDSVVYQFDGFNPLLPSSKEITNSLGETIKTEFKYPQDLIQNYEQAVVMNKMVNKNQVATPIITKTHNNNTVISEQRTLYEEIGSTILPKSVYAKKGEMSANVSTEDRKITYDHYDTKGNLLQYTLENGMPVSIIWGYDGQYPIAKIEGKAYSEIVNYAIDLINLSNSGTLVPASFEALRNTQDAIVTAYIYEPLVGVTTIIQPNGQYEKYIYDDAGRLKQVQDEQGRVLKEAGYHYYNPQP